MSKSVALLLSQTGGPPFHSVGYVNSAIGPILAGKGWQVRSFDPPRSDLGEEGMLPLALSAQLTALDAGSGPDVAFYDAAGTAIRAPSHKWARRNVVLYHGLAYGTGAWMTSGEIDLHCANSPYLERVLHAIFAFPNWRSRQCLNPAAMRALTSVRLPAPCVDAPDGNPGFSHGTQIPVEIQRQLDGNVIWGHALQPGKQDWIATLSIMYWLNELAASPAAKRIKLLVSEFSLNGDTRRALDAFLASTGRTCADYFLAVPHLNQRALFGLMRSCRFALAYNRFPEPFGFYVLESVHNGCPVYTNGTGNNRFLLPPGHGITVLEAPEMVEGAQGQRDPGAYRHVAQRILEDMASPDTAGSACQRGTKAIDEQWSLATFGDDLVSVLDMLERTPRGGSDFEELEVQLSPLVRSLDLDTGRCLNDYASVTLAAETVAIVRGLVGRRCADLDGDEMERLEAVHRLFGRGIVTLLPGRPRSSS